MARLLPSQPNLLVEEKEQKIAETISDRLSLELVIALVGPVASGVSTSALVIERVLRDEFGYQVAPIIKASDIIRHEAARVGIAIPPLRPISTYIHEMQTAGNALRDRFGNNYLVEKAVERIVKFRDENGGYAENGVPLPGRRAYIFDSIKNIEELRLLKQIYGDTLCLIGVFAPDEIRSERLVNDGADRETIKKILDRDQGEVATFGQMTRKVFVQSDLFICNDQKKNEIEVRIKRYFEIIFGTRIHTPTRAETAMHKAAAVAANSACMSRQVGAAIVSKKGELIGVGWNDVPKFGGGLYIEEDQFTWNQEQQAVVDSDHRCFKWGGNKCHNEIRRLDILDRIAKSVAASSHVRKETTAKDIRALLDGTDVDSLTEFSRAIHAEMEAILSVAREGRHSLEGATLYTTTYPCHNCARHIVAAGISMVMYIEPYLKSLATALHNDALTERRDAKDKVRFVQFDGVAPRNMLRMFSVQADRKVSGFLIEYDPKKAIPILRVPLDGSVEYETKVIADLQLKEQDSNVGATKPA